jgi:hypothetical protein
MYIYIVYVHSIYVIYICSYNQFFKVDPRVLAAWIALLKAEPRAKLVLIRNTSGTR